VSGTGSADPPAVPRFPNLPVPNGWFVVAEREDLAPGTVLPLHYFGQDLVAFRTADGRAQVLDAYCAHLGAHLGYGGAVVDECLQCPFHHWTYDADGRVVAAPYATRVPVASVRAWPTVERAGVVMVWHHRGGDLPAWEAPALPEHPGSEWGEPVRYRYVIRTHPQEIVENTFDFAHGQFVHNVPGGAEGGGATSTYSFDGTTAEVASPASRFRHHGLGISVLSGFASGAPVYERIAGMTPIDAASLEVRFRIYPARVEDADTRAAMRRMVEYLGVGINEDIPIWEHKIYREHPRLADRDGPITQLRRWARQFYDPVD
jgi:nitrite reductase/ring-hydroxylating ferredoxin subunit